MSWGGRWEIGEGDGRLGMSSEGIRGGEWIVGERRGVRQWGKGGEGVG